LPSSVSGRQQAKMQNESVTAFNQQDGQEAMPPLSFSGAFSGQSGCR